MERFSIRNAFYLFATLGAVSTAAILAAVVLSGGGWLGVALGSGLTSVLALGGAHLIGTHFARRANAVVDGLHELAAGNLTKKVRLKGKDDFAWITYEYDCARKALVKLVGELSENAHAVSDAAAQLVASSQSIANSSAEQSDAANSISAAVEEMATSVSQVADNAVDARAQTDRSGAQSREGAAVIGKVVAEVGLIADSVDQASRAIEELGRQSTEIRSIVRVIEDVAEQTNLLALNAAIEAARAGEQGRGFAVVADEVRKLAERTATSTREISAMIENIGRGTNSAINAMQSGVEKVAGGVSLAREAGEAIERIEDSVRGVTGAVADITSAMAEQRVATGGIARHVENIARMAEQNSRLTQESGATAAHLSSLAQVLKASAERFRISA